MNDEMIKAKVKCCSCGGSMKDSEHINGICLNKLATWKYPVWGNILVKDKHPEPRATAIICDKCVDQRKAPKYAVEWSADYSEITYHSIEKLQDLPEIKEEEVLEAERQFFFL